MYVIVVIQTRKRFPSGSFLHLPHMNTATRNVGEGGGGIHSGFHGTAPRRSFHKLNKHSRQRWLHVYTAWSKGVRPWAEFSGLPCKYEMDY